MNKTQLDGREIICETAKEKREYTEEEKEKRREYLANMRATRNARRRHDGVEQGTADEDGNEHAVRPTKMIISSNIRLQEKIFEQEGHVIDWYLFFLFLFFAFSHLAEEGVVEEVEEVVVEEAEVEEVEEAQQVRAEGKEAQNLPPLFTYRTFLSKQLKMNLQTFSKVTSFHVSTSSRTDPDTAKE